MNIYYFADSVLAYLLAGKNISFLYQTKTINLVKSQVI